MLLLLFFVKFKNNLYNFNQNIVLSFFDIILSYPLNVFCANTQLIELVIDWMFGKLFQNQRLIIHFI